jgi:hypothetical protein
MKILIDNVPFDYSNGCSVLKMKNNECPFDELKNDWDNIKPLSFIEISKINNLEQRRVAMKYFELEKLINEVNPTLVASESLNKSTIWIDEQGKEVNHSFIDTYELFRVPIKNIEPEAVIHSWQIQHHYYVRFKDTSTNRFYFIWVDIKDVFNTNKRDYGLEPHIGFKEELLKHITPYDCVAWTCMTNVPEGQIEKIIRQGDCFLIKITNINSLLINIPRHLTGKEYRELLVAES